MLNIKFIFKISLLYPEYSTAVVSKVWGVLLDGVQGILKVLYN
jgi:hypothetical protein